MKLLGTELVFSHEPLHQRFGTVTAATWVWFIGYSNFISIILFIYALFTPLAYPMLVYAIWIYVDRNTCQNGGRPNRWLQKLNYWRYLKNYFPGRLFLVPDFELDPKKNYLFCCFPHGLFSVGTIVNLVIHSSEIRRKYPSFNVRFATLTLFCQVPFFREIMLALGGISCSMRSLSYILGKPGGGHFVALLPGGTAEMLVAHSGRYKLIIKNRKGFAKVALKTGASLVPTITFGENDLFEQLDNSVVRRMQSFMQKRLGLPFILFKGRGFFQNSFGLIPKNKALTTVAGMPIDVDRVDDPTIEEINDLHGRFIKELINLFEKYKHCCAENGKDAHLELE